jgi:hypothetical protein
MSKINSKFVYTVIFFGILISIIVFPCLKIIDNSVAKDVIRDSIRIDFDKSIEGYLFKYIQDDHPIVLMTEFGNSKFYVVVQLIDGELNIATKQDGIPGINYNKSLNSNSLAQTFSDESGRFRVVIDSDGDGFPDRKIIFSDDHNEYKNYLIEYILNEATSPSP